MGTATVAGMAAHLLDEDLLTLAECARQVAEDKLAPHAAAVDELSQFPADSLAALVAADLHAVGIPEAYGGQGGSAIACAVVAEQLARSCTTTQQVAGANELFAGPLLIGGTEEQKRRWLPRIASGEALGAFALSEPEAGSDIASMTTKAVLGTDGWWTITGTKRWITNAGRAGLYVVFASTGERQVSCFVVEDGADGLGFGAPERKMGLKGSPTCEVRLERVRVPADHLVGEPGAGLRLALGTLHRSRVTTAAQAVGIAQGALDIAVEYAGTREQFGRRIGDFQGLQFMLADMAMAVESARLMVYAAARELDDSAASPRSTSGAAAKCFASDVAMRVTTDAVQVLGGAGYTRDFGVERMMRDAKITQIYEGTNQIQRSVIAAGLLGA